MLELRNITKEYHMADETVPALKGISLKFRDNEFVSILGPSGCGKTTLLNIIGGLDRYTLGNMYINERSTEEYKDADWDAYRNHSIGFVFQNYNLIPHQTVLHNVELALTLSGVGKTERRARAINALETVGLGDQIKKKPNQMSGGQMQRVAIARAIVNNPDILLADEPTGALDTATSIQIMDILKDIAKDRLVIMVTHNPDLAEAYSTRIIRLKDGLVTDDSDPYDGSKGATTQAPADGMAPAVAPEEAKKKEQKEKKKRTSLSFLTALSLSLNNLMTKKTRTILVSLAGSIGIIGIALILSLSNGISIYINKVQEDALSSYPITLEENAQDLSALLNPQGRSDSKETEEKVKDPNRIYVNNSAINLVNALNSRTHNDLKSFKAYLESHMDEIRDCLTDLQYTYHADLQLFSSDGKTQINPSTVMESMGMGNMAGYSALSSSFSAVSEMLSNENLLQSQYDCIAGHWPDSWDEIVLVVSKNNTIPNLSLYMLGLKDQAELAEQFEAAMSNGEVEIKAEDISYSFDELLGMTFYIVPNSLFYADSGETYEADGQSYPIYRDKRDDPAFDQESFIKKNGVPVRISGILRPNPDATATSINTLLGYTNALAKHVYALNNDQPLVKVQLDSPDYDITTGLEFDKGQYNNLSDSEKARILSDYLEKNENMKALIMLNMLSQLTPEEADALAQSKMSTLSRENKEQLVTENIGYILTEMPDTLKTLTLNYLKATDPEAYEANAAMLESMDVSTLMQTLSSMGVNMDPENATEEQAAAFKAGIQAMDDETLDTIVHDYFVSKAQNDSASELAKTYTTAELIMLFDARYATMTDSEKAALYNRYMPKIVSDETYEQVLYKLGYVDEANPATISIYAKDFQSKDTITDFIADYNRQQPEEKQISYTDIVKIMMSSITLILNVITYVLIAFVSISLVVSSIMIGIITYISVLERTKEIGILRSIGASKGDVGRVFNAETVIIGLAAGIFGIAITLFLTIPINIIIRAVSGIGDIGAQLPVLGGVILIAISVILTLIAGLIPARLASRKDPVIALRSE